VLVGQWLGQGQATSHNQPHNGAAKYSGSGFAVDRDRFRPDLVDPVPYSGFWRGGELANREEQRRVGPSSLRPMNPTSADARPPALGPGPGEPAAGPWRRSAPDTLLQRLLGSPAAPARHVLAVDGRSGSGKTTLARRLLAACPGSALVSTDDLAWHHSLFDWAPLAVDGVLAPFRRGEEVRYRPPAWDVHGRSGELLVPAGTRVLLLEGVGASQASLAGHLDAAVWVQSDFATAARLGIARDIASGVNGDPDQAAAFWREWEAQEIPFLQRERPWERADVIVAGTGSPPDEALWVAAPSPRAVDGPSHPNS